jgi:hypothetical protein
LIDCVVPFIRTQIPAQPRLPHYNGGSQPSNNTKTTRTFRPVNNRNLHQNHRSTAKKRQRSAQSIHKTITIRTRNDQTKRNNKNTRKLNDKFFASKKDYFYEARLYTNHKV